METTPSQRVRILVPRSKYYFFLGGLAGVPAAYAVYPASVVQDMVESFVDNLLWKAKLSDRLGHFRSTLHFLRTSPEKAARGRVHLNRRILFRGSMTSCFPVYADVGGHFFGLHILERLLRRLREKRGTDSSSPLRLWETLCVGAGGRAAGVLTQWPFSLGLGFSSAVERLDSRAFLRGRMIRDVPSGTMMFLCYQSFRAYARRRIPRRKPLHERDLLWTVMTAAPSSFLASICATLFSQPFHVIETRVEFQSKPFFQVLREILGESSGVGGLWADLFWVASRKLVFSTICWTLFEIFLWEGDRRRSLQNWDFLKTLKISAKNTVS